MNVHERATLTLAEYLNEQGIETVQENGETFAVVDGTRIRLVVTVTDAVEMACPRCGHDVDHTRPCPAGCPECEPPVFCSRCGNDMVREAHAPTCSAAALIRERWND